MPLEARIEVHITFKGFDDERKTKQKINGVNF